MSDRILYTIAVLLISAATALTGVAAALLIL